MKMAPAKHMEETVISVEKLFLLHWLKLLNSIYGC